MTSDASQLPGSDTGNQQLAPQTGPIGDYTAPTAHREEAQLAHAATPVQGYDEWWKVGKRVAVGNGTFDNFVIPVGTLWQEFNSMLNNFERFRGTLEVEFKVMAQSFDFGCGYLGWEPEDLLTNDVNTTPWQTMSFTEGILVDLRGHNHVKLQIPWSGQTKYKSTDLTGLGILYFKTVVPIQSQSASPAVQYLMYVRVLDIDQNIPVAQSGGSGIRRIDYGFKSDTSIASFDKGTVGIESLHMRPTGHSVVDLDKDPSGTFQIDPLNGLSRLERLLRLSQDWNYTLRVHATAVKTSFHSGIVTFYRTRSSTGNTNRASEKIVWDLTENDSICFDVHFNPNHVMSGGTNNIFVWATEGLVSPDTVEPGVRIVFAVSAPQLLVSGLAQCWDWKSDDEVMVLGSKYEPAMGKKTFKEVNDGVFQLTTLNTQGGDNHLVLYNTLESVSSAPARVLKLFARHASSFDFSICPQAGILSYSLTGFGSNLPARFDQLCEVNFGNVGASSSVNIAAVTSLPPVGVPDDGTARPLMLNQGEESNILFHPSAILYSPVVKEPNRAASLIFNEAMRPSSFSLSLKVDPNSFYALTSRNLS